jgi:rRNA maturation RNase YbeY
MISRSKSKVYFLFDEVKILLKERNRLKKFILSIFKKEGKNLISLNYVFCSDRKILKINGRFLNKDYFTDTITFDLSENENGIIGEVYISIDRVKENAEKLGKSFNSEIHRVIFHGALHLCGYVDDSLEDFANMRKKENELLIEYFE